MTKIVPVSDAKTRFYDLVNRVQIGDEVIVTKNGKPTVVLLNAQELSALRETLDVLSDPELMKQIRLSERQLRGKKKRLHPFEEVFGEPLVGPERKRRGR